MNGFRETRILLHLSPDAQPEAMEKSKSLLYFSCEPLYAKPS